jgi:hypothetical protein
MATGKNEWERTGKGKDGVPEHQHEEERVCMREQLQVRGKNLTPQP